MSCEYWDPSWENGFFPGTNPLMFARRAYGKPDPGAERVSASAELQAEIPANILRGSNGFAGLARSPGTVSDGTF